MIAALYVQTNGCYFGSDDVDPWDEVRDARRYAGPHSVVAHPPCARWCRLAGFVEKVHGKQIGDDGGTFEAALESVRKWGGVLEHPAYSIAFERFGLPSPIPSACVSWGDSDRYHDVERMGKRERSATPEPFRKLLLELATLAGSARGEPQA